MVKALVVGFVIAIVVSLALGTSVAARATMDHQTNAHSSMHGDDSCPLTGDSPCLHNGEDHDSMMADHESHHASMMNGAMGGMMGGTTGSTGTITPEEHASHHPTPTP